MLRYDYRVIAERQADQETVDAVEQAAKARKQVSHILYTEVALYEGLDEVTKMITRPTRPAPTRLARVLQDLMEPPWPGGVLAVAGES